MLNIHSKSSPHYGAMGVFKAALSDNEVLHAAIKNMNILDGFVKSVSIFDVPPMAVIVIERWGEPHKRLFRTKYRRRRYQITLRLLKLSTTTNMCELTCSIKPLRMGQAPTSGHIEDVATPENWIVAFQSKVADNISQAGGRTFQTLPAARA